MKLCLKKHTFKQGPYVRAMARDPSGGLDRARTTLEEAFAERGDAVKQKLARGTLLFIGALAAGSTPASAQGVEQIEGLLTNLADLLQSIGLTMAVVGLSVASICYIAHKPKLAKRIAQNVILGTVMLLLSSGAIDYISQNL